MFEARLTQGKVLKQLVEALRDLVQEANLDCSEDEVSIQAMDNSHVSLVSVSLRSGGFDHFRCDRPISLGFNAANMGKILKCAGNDDVITLKAKDDGDALELVFESPSQDRIADFGESSGDAARPRRRGGGAGGACEPLRRCFFFRPGGAICMEGVSILTSRGSGISGASLIRLWS